MAIDMNDYLKNKGGGSSNNTGGGKPPFNETPEFIKNFGKKAGLVYILVAVVFIGIIARPFIIINSGEIGIISTLGKFDKSPLYPGIHFFLPFMQKVLVVDTRVRIANYTKEDTAGDKRGIIQNSSITVLDSRGLPVDVELTIQYHLKAETASEAIAGIGLNWEDKVVTPNVRDVVRSVIGNFAAEELPIKRNTIAQLIQAGMVKALESLPNKPIALTAIQIRGILLPEKVKEQIERVQIANQEAEKAKYEVEKAKQVAEGKRIEAQGVADAAVISATGNAKANEMLAKSLNGNLIKLRQIESQQKFNEALAVNKDAKIFLTPNGAVPNIWVDMKSGDEKEKVSVNGK